MLKIQQKTGISKYLNITYMKTCKKINIFLTTQWSTQLNCQDLVITTKNLDFRGYIATFITKKTKVP